MVKLKLLPVCECGYVFRDGIVIEKTINVIDKIKDSDSVIKYPKYSINPPMCPNCKRMIESVEYNNIIT